LLNPDACLPHTAINRTTGEAYEAGTRLATDFIPVSINGLYCNVGLYYGTYGGSAVYNSNKEYIRKSDDNKYTYQEGDAYVRFTINTLERFLPFYF
jgi:hypothetical protein